MKVKYPEIEVQLSGEDGNVFSIISRATKAARRGGLTQEQIDEFQDEMKSGDSDHARQTCTK